MAMLDGLRNVFMQSLKFCKSKVAFDILIEKWNKECEEVYKYKQALIAEERAKHQTTADVAEVKHGEWIGVADYGNGNCIGYCSVCGTTQKAESATHLKAFHKHCRWCGAKMDGRRAVPDTNDGDIKV